MEDKTMKGLNDLSDKTEVSVVDTSKKMRIGIIGCGWIAGSHMDSYLKQPDVEIVAGADLIPGKAEAFFKQYGVEGVKTDYASHKEMLDDESLKLDAVSVCTHNDFHSIIAIDFLRAGKHVMCEKPAARILSEALEMQKVAHETGRMLQIGVVNRFCDNVNHVRKLIADGELGEVYQVYVSFRAHRSIPGLGGDFTTKACSGGGALIDWGVHYIDLILYCLGDPKVLTASGEAFCKLGKDMKNYVYESMWAEDTKNTETGTYDVDDSVVGLVRTTGPVISFNGAWAQNIGEREMFIDFMGDKAGIRLQYCSDFQLWTVKNGMLTETKVSARETNMYENEINDFIRCIKTGDKNQQYIDYTVETSKILQAIYDSSENHCEIKIS